MMTFLLLFTDSSVEIWKTVLIDAVFGLKMSLTIQQIILDAKRLASRLKEHDSAADALLSQTQSVYKQIDAMKQVGNTNYV
jgi:hypothetical protein